MTLRAVAISMLRVFERPTVLVVVLFVSVVSALWGGAILRAGSAEGPFAIPASPLTFALGVASTGALTFALLFFAVAARANDAVILRTLFGGTVAGALNAVIVMCSLAAFDGGLPWPVMVIAPMAGGLLGPVFGVVLALPVLFVWEVDARRTLRGAAWMAWVAGAWAVPAAGLVALGAPELAIRAPAAVLAALAAVAFIAAPIAIARRAWWLARVRAGRIPGYAIVVHDAATHGPLPRWSPFSTDHAVLVREHAVADGAYRTVVSREPIAYVGRVRAQSSRVSSRMTTVA